MWAWKKEGEEKTNFHLQIACLNLYKTWQQKGRQVALWLETLLCKYKCHMLRPNSSSGVYLLKLLKLLSRKGTNTSTCLFTLIQLYELNEFSTASTVCQLLKIIWYCLYSLSYPCHIYDCCDRCKSMIEVSGFVGYLIHCISQKQTTVFSYFVYKQFLNWLDRKCIYWYCGIKSRIERNQECIGHPFLQS